MYTIKKATSLNNHLHAKTKVLNHRRQTYRRVFDATFRILVVESRVEKVVDEEKG